MCLKTRHDQSYTVSLTSGSSLEPIICPHKPSLWASSPNWTSHLSIYLSTSEAPWLSFAARWCTNAVLHFNPMLYQSVVKCSHMKTRHQEVMIRTKVFPILLLLATKKTICRRSCSKNISLIYLFSLESELKMHILGCSKRIVAIHNVLGLQPR